MPESTRFFHLDPRVSDAQTARVNAWIAINEREGYILCDPYPIGNRGAAALFMVKDSPKIIDPMFGALSRRRVTVTKDTEVSTDFIPDTAIPFAEWTAEVDET